MKEYSARMISVDLDGQDGCAFVDVRIHMSIADARKNAHHMLNSGFPLRVLVPEALPTGSKAP